MFDVQRVERNVLVLRLQPLIGQNVDGGVGWIVLTISGGADIAVNILLPIRSRLIVVVLITTDIGLLNHCTSVHRLMTSTRRL